MPTKRVTSRVTLLRHTPNPEETIAMSARLCYSPLEIEDLKGRVEDKDQKKFIRQLRDMGHLTAFEHVSFTFGLEGVSRTLLAQITRHRIATFSVQSQRYVTKSDEFTYILPPAIEALGEEAIKEFTSQMETLYEWYNNWRERLLQDESTKERANEDARFVLPGAAETRLMLTMNARELLHFFSLRCCNRAQWEIRGVAHKMLAELLKVSPVIFEAAGPGCVHGKCPEGNKSCGKASQVRGHLEAMVSQAVNERKDTYA